MSNVGDLAVIEGIDVLAAVGDTIRIDGDLVVTEAVDVLAAAGEVLVQGDLAVTEAIDVLAAVGEVLVQGDLAVTEAIDVLAAVGEVLVQGDLAVTEAVDVLAAVGEVLVQGDLAVTDALDTVAVIVIVSSVILSTEGAIDGYTINDLTPINGQVLGLGLPTGAPTDNERLMFVSVGPSGMLVEDPPKVMVAIELEEV